MPNLPISTSRSIVNGVFFEVEIEAGSTPNVGGDAGHGGQSWVRIAAGHGGSLRVRVAHEDNAIDFTLQGAGEAEMRALPDILEAAALTLRQAQAFASGRTVAVLPDGARNMESQFDNSGCRVCGLRIFRGNAIEWARGLGVTHLHCTPAAKGDPAAKPYADKAGREHAEWEARQPKKRTPEEVKADKNAARRAARGSG